MKGSISGYQTELSPEQKRTLLADLMDQDASDVRLCPLSLAQQRMWFLEQLEPQTAAYNLFSGLRLRGKLDAEALRRSVERAVARHETLRTAFLALNGEVFQRILPRVEINIPVIDLRGTSDSTREREAYEIAFDESRAAFDLQCSPLLRVKLIRMGGE